LPYAGLHDLRRVALDAWQRRSLLIAIGVEQTYARSRAAEIIGELVEWTRSDEERVQRHAAQSFVRLARRSAESSESQWPELLGRLRDGELGTEQVAELWILSLSYPPTASSAWRVLTYWINRAEHHPAVAQPLLDVVDSMTGVEQITVRLRHQMRHVWREQRPASPVLTGIAAIIKES
jgi:hypothetical protein